MILKLSSGLHVQVYTHAPIYPPTPHLDPQHKGPFSLGIISHCQGLGGINVFLSKKSQKYQAGVISRFEDDYCVLGMNHYLSELWGGRRYF